MSVVRESVQQQWGFVPSPQIAPPQTAGDAGSASTGGTSRSTGAAVLAVAATHPSPARPGPGPGSARRHHCPPAATSVPAFTHCATAPRPQRRTRGCAPDGSVGTGGGAGRGGRFLPPDILGAALGRRASVGHRRQTRGVPLKHYKGVATDACVLSATFPRGLRLRLRFKNFI